MKRTRGHMATPQAQGRQLLPGGKGIYVREILSR